MVFAAHQYESATGIHVSPAHLPASPPHPSRLSQGAGSGCPASYVKLALKYISFLY